MTSRFLIMCCLLMLSAALPAFGQTSLPSSVSDQADKTADEKKQSQGEFLLNLLRQTRVPLTRERLFTSPLTLDDLLAEPQSGRQPQSPQPKPATPAAPLMLEDVLTQVITNHPKLLGADAERQIASAKRLEKQGAFDPVVSFGTDFLQYNSTSRPGSLLRARTNDVELEYLTRSGVKFVAGSRFNFGSIKSPLSSTGETGEYFAGIRIPLLRNFRINEKSAAERQALIGEPLAAETLRITQLELQLKAAESYWDWVAAKRKREVARNLLTIAKTRAEAIGERVKSGDLPPIDSVEAQQEVQRREGGVTKAERDLQKAAFKLSLFLWDTNGQPAPVPVADNVPTTFAPPVLFTDERAVEGQRLALEQRPELKVIALGRDIAQVDLDLGRNQRRPAIELGFYPGRDTGVGGVGNTLKAGMTFALPLRQRTADGKIQAAQLKIQKLELDLQNQRQTILVEVNDALNAINTTYERYRAAEREAELARELEQGERIRFNFGDSTLFLVNQRERATAEAENKVIEIHAEYEQSVAAFRAATGVFRP